MFSERGGSPVLAAQSASERERQLGVEQLDDGRCEARPTIENGGYFLSVRNGGFLDRYRKGVSNMGLRCPFPDQSQYGFVLSAQPSSLGVSRLDRHPGHPGKDEGGLDADQPTMLAQDVQFMEGPKFVVPTLIRFQRFDDVSFGLGKPLYEFSSLVVSPAEREFARSNRKIRVFAVRVAVAICKGGGEEIEGTANGVDIDSHLNVERERERFFFNRYHQIVRGLRVRLFDLGAYIEMDPGAEAMLQRWELGYGPVNARLSV